MHLVTVEQLRRQPDAVILALRQGNLCCLTEHHQVIAYLTPVNQPAAQGNACDVVITRLEHAEAILTPETLSAILNLTHATYAMNRTAAHFDSPVVQRLDALTEALTEQASVLPLAQQQKWWRQRHPELKGWTPAEHLRMPWLPHSPRWLQLRELIRRHRILNARTL